MEILRVEDGGIAITEEWIQRRVEKYQARSLFLPAGETPKPLYAKWRERWPSFLEGVDLLQVDDVLNGSGKDMFSNFFRQELPGRIVKYPVKGGKADLAILGFGTNGHVAFHEPFLPADFSFGEVDLEAETAKRLGIESTAKGITYGVGTFLQCRAILLVVRGAGKQKVFDRFLQGDPKVPASGLKEHADLVVLKDF